MNILDTINSTLYNINIVQGLYKLRCKKKMIKMSLYKVGGRELDEQSAYKGKRITGECSSPL